MSVGQPFFRLKGDALVLIDWANIYGSFERNGWLVDTEKLLPFLQSHQEVKDVVFFCGEDAHPKSSEFLNVQRVLGYNVISKKVKHIPVRIDESIFRSKVNELDKDLALLREKNNAVSELLYSLDERLRKYLEKEGAVPMDEFYDVFDIIDQIDREIGNTNESLQYLWNNVRDTIVRRKCDFDVEISREVLLNLDTYQSFIIFSGDGDYAPIFDVLRERKKQAILVFPKGCRGKEYEESTERKQAMFLCSLEKLRMYIEKTST